jgi:hypothetical protein
MFTLICLTSAMVFGNIAYAWHVTGHEGMTIANGVVALGLSVGGILYEVYAWTRELP